ncbi:MAG TPA: cytochrome C oxidase Cbb3 [Cyclobacteriaceae bacterium]
MYKDILSGIDNVAIWPTISFVIFFLFFLILIWWVLTADSSFIKKMSNKPFEDEIESKSSETLNPNEL